MLHRSHTKLKTSCFDHQKTWSHKSHPVVISFIGFLYHRIQFKILLLTYDASHRVAPSYLKDLISLYVPPRTLRAGRPVGNLVTVSYRTKTFDLFCRCPNTGWVHNRNQFDMYCFVSQSWCAFWQKNDVLLKWSIVKSTSEPKPQRKAYHLKDTLLLCDF